jgi:glycosyltransferase involved in cell wall biosynthesis
MARVRVVVPLYNKASTVRRALNSIAEQTFRDFEVRVIDDGSTDDSAAIAESFDDPRFQVIRQDNLGPGAARNRGAAGSASEWLAFLDADDEWEAGFLQGSLDAAERWPAAATVTSGYRLFPEGTSTDQLWRTRGLESGEFRLTPRTHPVLAVHALAFMSPWSTIVRTSVFRKWGGYYENHCLYAEDAYLWLKVLLNETAVFEMEPRVRNYIDTSSLAGNLRRRTPVEPFLTDPSGIQNVCPKQLRVLLARLLAVRAFKRAVVLGYWGQWRDAAAIRKRFAVEGSWGLPYSFVSLAAGTPFVGWAGAFVRMARKWILRS